MQREASKRLDDGKPWLIMASTPPAVGRLAEDKSSARLKGREMEGTVMKDALMHVAFTVELCRRQARAGRLFVLEYPASAKPWQTTIVEKLMNEEKVRFVSWAKSPVDARKMKRVMITNSTEVINDIGKRTGDESAGERCEMLCKAAMRERNGCRQILGCLGKMARGDEEAIDVTKELNALMQSPHDEEQIYDQFDFIDDVSGRVLDRDLAIAARKLEMSFFRQKGVYEKVPRTDATMGGGQGHRHEMARHQQR